MGSDRTRSGPAGRVPVGQPDRARFRRRSAVVSAILVLAALATALAARQEQASALSTAALTIFEGSVSLQIPGRSPVPGHSGDSLLGGEVIRTGHDTKAALSYLDGSVTRLDSDTSLTLRSLSRDRGGLAVDLYQDSGQTWHRVAQLSGAASYRVSLPNNTTAEVRGTEFDARVTRSPDGQVSVRVDCWQGALDVSSKSTKVFLAGGQSVTSTASGLGNAVPISPAVRQDPWTVYNKAFDAVVGSVVGIYSGRLSTGESTPVQPGGAGDGQTGLQFTLAWPGSTFELGVYDPDGEEYRTVASSSPPLTIVVAEARPGAWSFRVHDLESSPEEAWVLIVSRRPAPARTGTAPGASQSPGGAPVASSPGSGSTPPSASPSGLPGALPVALPGASPAAPPAPQPLPSTPPAPQPSPLPSAGGPTITSAAVGTTRVNQPYTKHLVAHGGTLPYRWGLAGGPAWLAIDSRSGALFGAPNVIGTYTLAVTVTDADNRSGSRTYTLQVIA